MKKILAMVLAVAMVLGGIYWVDMAGDEVKAATEANSDMLNVKVQVATDDSNVIRFVTSVDSLDYSNVGFEVTPEGGVTKTYTTTRVFERIASSEENVEYTFSPKVVDTSSEYFATAKLRAEADVDYTVKAFATQKNGEKIYGATRCVGVKDGKSTTTLNLTYEATTAPEVGSTINVTYGKDNQATTAEVLAVDGKNVSVRVTVNPTTLPSATKFTFGSTGSAIYRNLYTKYTGEGTEDTTWYDVYLAADSKETEFTIATNADMYGFMTMYAGENLFKNKTLYVIRDIAMNDNVTKATVESWANGTEAPYKWNPSGDDNSGTRFQGTFDGQMHKLSGFYVNEVGIYAGVFGSTDLGSVIKNFYLEDSYFTNEGSKLTGGGDILFTYLGSVAGENRGTVSNIYSNAIVATSGERTGGIIGVHNTTTAVAAAGKQAIVDNCWFDGEVRLLGETGKVGGGIVGMVQQRESTMSNLLFTGKVTAETTGEPIIGGIVGTENNKCIINMLDCISVGTLSAGESATAVGAAVGRVNQSGSVHRMVNVYSDSTMGALVGTGSATADHPGLSVSISTLYGTDIYRNTLLDVEEIWGARTDAAPVLRTFTEKYDKTTIVNNFDGLKRDNWFNDNMKAYGLRSASAMYKLSDLSNVSKKSFSGMYICLMEDIDMNPGWSAPKSGTEDVSGNPVVFKSIADNETVANGGSGAPLFKGIFDGRNHTLKGLYINTAALYYGGLFGKCDKGSVVQNLAITNSYMRHTGQHWAGSVMGLCMGGTISNVYSDMVIKADSNQVGGMAGRFEGTITNCWFDGEIYETKTAATDYGIGGIVGAVGRSNACTYLTIDNCLYTGKIILSMNNASNTTNLCVGGILGDRRNTTDTITLENCVVGGTIETKSKTGVGTLIGVLGNHAKVHTITNCYGRDDAVTGFNEIPLVGVIKASAAGSTITGALVKEAQLQGTQAYETLELDYTAWVARKNDTVIPTTFVNWIVPASETVAKPAE